MNENITINSRTDSNLLNQIMGAAWRVEWCRKPKIPTWTNKAKKIDVLENVQLIWVMEDLMLIDTRFSYFCFFRGKFCCSKRCENFVISVDWSVFVFRFNYRLISIKLNDLMLETIWWEILLMPNHCLVENCCVISVNCKFWSNLKCQERLNRLNQTIDIW